ncbi:MAG TPA: glycosyltransferase family A protein [Candidatus Paceibacterota bacterium]|nr:glycosyltransferase family A protein [Candidatus Paceibacterota bacterium]
MKISVVIPAYNEEHYIGPCIQSVQEQHSADIFEIIVVENGSTDNTLAAAKKFRGVTAIHEPKKGLSNARQRGFLEAKGDHVAFIDADSRIPAGWADIVKKEFARDPGLVCLSGPFHYYDLPPLQKFFAELLWDITAMPTYWLTGFMALFANCVVRREALAKIGGIDTRIAFYGDDTNLAWRLSKVGKVKFTMKFYILGSGRRLAQTGLIRTFWRYGTSYLSMALLHRSPGADHYDEVR